MRSLFVPVASLVLSLGCAAPKPVAVDEGPNVVARTDKLDEKSQSLSGLQAVAVVVLKNEGAAAVTATKATWELVTGGKVVKKGETPLSVEVPAGGEANVEVPAAFEYATTIEEIVALGAKKAPIEYALRGVITVGSGEVEFAKATQARAPRMPVLKLGGVEALHSPSTGLTFNASIDLDNPNPFPLELKGLHYKLSLGGKPAGSGAIERKAAAKAASHTSYEISVLVEASELKDRKELQGSTVPWALEGELDLGDAKIPLSESGETRLLRAGD